MRIVRYFPLGDDDGVARFVLPVSRREVKARRVIHIVTGVVPVRDRAELASVRRLFSTRHGTLRAEFATIRVIFKHAGAFARPIDSRHDRLGVQRRIAVVRLTVPRRVPVHPALTLSNLVPSGRVARCHGRSLV